MAARCQLYLSIPASFSGAHSLIEEVLAAGRAPSLLIVGNAGGERLRAIVAAAHRQNAAVLIQDDVLMAKSIGADGVHLRTPGAGVREVREALGADSIVGADCGLSRHDALTLGEAGADYVAFRPDEAADEDALDGLAEMIDWWSGLIEIPCAAYLPGDGDEAVMRMLVECKADFIIPSPSIWDQPEGLRERVGRLANYCGGERARAIT